MRRPRSSAGLAGACALAACGGPQRPAGPPPCPTAAQVTVASQDEVDALAACTAIGRLTVRTGMALDLAPLARLERAAALTIGPTIALDHLSLPALRQVDGDLTVTSNTLLGGVFLPQLAAAGNVTIAANSAVTTVSLPRLARTGALRIEGNGSLEIVDLGQLVTADSLGIVSNASLGTIELSPALAAPSRVIEGNRAPAELQPVGPTSTGGDHEY